MEFRKLAYRLGWDHLKAFRGCMWTVRYLLDQIESQRVELTTAGSAEDFQLLGIYQAELGATWAVAEDRFRDLLLHLSVPAELGRLRAFIGSAALKKEPYDHESSDARDTVEARRQVRIFDELVALQRLIDRELRRAFSDRPTSEKEVQDVFEALLIGKDIDYHRELPIASTLGGVRRPDFSISALDAYVEIKLCQHSHGLERIKDEVAADIVTYGTRGKRLFFVIFDCGYVRDPIALETSLEHAVHACPARDVCVCVVKL